MQAFIQTFMETFSKLYSSTTSNPKIQKETPVKQQDSDITKIDEYPVLDGNLIIGNDGHILPLEDYKMLVDIYGAKVIKYQIEKIRKKYPPTYMNLKIISRSYLSDAFFYKPAICPRSSLSCLYPVRR